MITLDKVMIDREACVICDHEHLDELGSWENFPVCVGTTVDDTDTFADQLWSICKQCGAVQLTKVVRPEILYEHSHRSGTTGNIWNRHHEEFADFVFRNGARVILEVGAGNMQLANAIHSHIGNKLSTDKYFVMDPNIDTSDMPPRTFVFPYMWTHDIKTKDVPAVDTIIHSHTMEHFNWVRKDIKAMADKLPENGLMCISIPVIDKFLKRGWTNGLNFEHTYLTTITNIDYIIKDAGFRIINHHWFSDYNVFIAARKMEGTDHPLLINEHDSNKKLFIKYMTGLLNDVKHINERLDNFYPKFIFGAHIFGQTLLHSGLNEGKFLSVLDNDPNKHGHRLYGSSLTVASPEVIRDLPKPIVIVRAAQYTTEIVKGLKEINSSVQII